MIRTASIMLVAAALCAAAGAQGPTKTNLTAAQQHELFQRNRTMIVTLVDSSLEISNQSGDYIVRSRSYRKVVNGIHDELSRAAESGDAARVAELGKHFDTILRQGLAPSLKAADRQIGPEGTGRKDLQEIRDRTVELVNWLQDKAKNKWADTPEVREVIESLERTKKELGNSVAP
jgi:hypothetical protein